MRTEMTSMVRPTLAPDRVAAIVVGAGFVAALNYGKLPPALDALRDGFDLSLVQASWMVSLFTLAATAFGIAGGAITDRFGARRVLIWGLVTLAVGGALGASARSAPMLFTSRLLESFGCLFAVLPGPALLRAALPPNALRAWLGVWAGYMPAGMSFALIVTPALLALGGWRLAWWAGAAMALAWAGLVARLPADADPAGAATDASAPATSDPSARRADPRPGFLQAARMTLCSRGPWLIAICFAAYAGQFIGVFSFLPMIYAQGGIAASSGGALTAFAVLVNVAGNVVAGILLHRGVEAHRLIAVSGLAMAVCAWVTFGYEGTFAVQYGAVVLFSMVGGLIPGALYATAPFFAPHPFAVSSTVGLLQQGSGLGHMIVPMLMAMVAQQRGDWSGTWIVTGAAAVVTIVLAWAIGRHDHQLRSARH